MSGPVVCKNCSAATYNDPGKTYLVCGSCFDSLRVELAKEREESRRGFENDETIASLRLKLEAAEDLAKGWDLLAVKRGESLEAAEAQVAALVESIQQHLNSPTARASLAVLKNALDHHKEDAAKYQAVVTKAIELRDLVEKLRSKRVSDDFCEAFEAGAILIAKQEEVIEAVRQLKED